MPISLLGSSAVQNIALSLKSEILNLLNTILYTLEVIMTSWQGIPDTAATTVAASNKKGGTHEKAAGTCQGGGGDAGGMYNVLHNCSNKLKEIIWFINTKIGLKPLLHRASRWKMKMKEYFILKKVSLFHPRWEIKLVWWKMKDLDEY